MTAIERHILRADVPMINYPIDRCLGKEKFLFLPVRYKMSNFLSNCQGI
ncbi:hypothetical protein VL20_1363 [Microcystis panniformis FACHB-1757]|uniref:Uncharacterized protein n=1 Tax=Microcystis panniformis FACHB-1757 TaxID=1638788 RepID=A0A0K1RXC1_9CHRO|nr:hypothetical protein VL20_1363 [Microcystis panniformis FACHB-1757]